MKNTFSGRADIVSRESIEVGAEIKGYIEDAGKRFPKIKDVKGIIVKELATVSM